jgi:cysteine synthase B
MILEGEASGQLTRGRTILDATSGNTGIAYAMVGAARGYKVKLCLPENASPERKLILRALGADLVFTNPLEGSDGAIREARRLYGEDPDRYFYPDQYNNDANWQAHYDTTAPEIIEQTSGRLTHFIAGLGTSGTFIGTGRRLRKFNAGIKLISFQPDSPFHGLEGLKLSFRYFSAPSGNTVTMMPRSRPFATSSIAATAAPDEMPASRPSSRARRRTMRYARSVPIRRSLSASVRS